MHERSNGEGNRRRGAGLGGVASLCVGQPRGKQIIVYVLFVLRELYRSLGSLIRTVRRNWREQLSFEKLLVYEMTVILLSIHLEERYK